MTRTESRCGPRAIYGASAATDGLSVDARRLLRRPSVQQVAGKPEPSPTATRPCRASVCLAYAGLWYDPFAQRVPIAHHADGNGGARARSGLGLAPTALALAGWPSPRATSPAAGAAPRTPRWCDGRLAAASFRRLHLAGSSLAAAKPPT